MITSVISYDNHSITDDLSNKTDYEAIPTHFLTNTILYYNHCRMFYPYSVPYRCNLDPNRNGPSCALEEYLTNLHYRPYHCIFLRSLSFKYGDLYRKTRSE